MTEQPQDWPVSIRLAHVLPEIAAPVTPPPARPTLESALRQPGSVAPVGQAAPEFRPFPLGRLKPRSRGRKSRWTNHE